MKTVAKQYRVSVTRLRKAGLKIKAETQCKVIPTITPQASCAQRTKLKAIQYKGGKCLVCGYNKSMRALTFHHLDPSKKDFGISGGTKSFEAMKDELDKCVLLCANHHAEVHDGLINL